MLGFIIGLVLGSVGGIALMALFSMAGKDDYDG